MYLEKRRVKGKTQYYLGHSFREGKDVHKLRKYLGADLSSALLKEREEIAKKLILDEINKYKIIKDPLHEHLSGKELEFVRRLEKDIPPQIKHLSEEDWTEFSELFTYNTNAIEGSELNSKEVKAVLEDDLWPIEKTKADIAEAYGVNDAITIIRHAKEHISLDLIRGIHRIVFRNSKPFAGHFRQQGEEVVVMGRMGNIVHQGAPQSRITALLKELVDWYEKNKRKYPGLVLAAVVHNQFENIHPFRDGNGRVGRILLNNILLRHGLPPISIDLKNMAKYYSALQAYENEHDLKPTLELFMEEYKALRRILEK
jgi:Fic family protein